MPTPIDLSGKIERNVHNEQASSFNDFKHKKYRVIMFDGILK